MNMAQIMLEEIEETLEAICGLKELENGSILYVQGRTPDRLKEFAFTSKEGYIVVKIKTSQSEKDAELGQIDNNEELAMEIRDFLEKEGVSEIIEIGEIY